MKGAKIYTKIEARRPDINCAKRDINTALDDCGYFEEGRFNEHFIPKEKVKKVKAWSE